MARAVSGDGGPAYRSLRSQSSAGACEHLCCGLVSTSFRCVWGMGPDRTQNAAPLAAKSRVVGPPRGSKSDSMGSSTRLLTSLLSLMAEVERLACPGEGDSLDASVVRHSGGMGATVSTKLRRPRDATCARPIASCRLVRYVCPCAPSPSRASI
eukprot:2360776-Pleurochrysis_carterae.AAC.1